MSARSGRKMVSWTAFAPAVYKFSCTAGEACSHICITEGKNFTLFINTLCNNKFEMTVSVLSNGKISYRTRIRIELRQITAACLSVEYLYNLHCRLFIGNIRVAGAAVTDNCNIVIKVNRIHFGKLTCSRNCL